MENPVLVTFATRYGSTEETAQAVAQSLRDCGLGVDLVPIDQVASLERYSAVVLGAALYMGRLHKDARRFIQEWRDPLATMPVALFVPGPVETRDKDWAGAREQLDKELARYPWLKPITSEIVGGTFDAKRLGFPWKFIPAMRKMPVSDARDWEKIRRWTDNLAAILQPGAGMVEEAAAEPPISTTQN